MTEYEEARPLGKSPLFPDDPEIQAATDAIEAYDQNRVELYRASWEMVVAVVLGAAARAGKNGPSPA